MQKLKRMPEGDRTVKRVYICKHFSLK